MSIDIELVSRIVFWGLISGSIFSLLAIGLNIIFGVMKVVNFAHGEIMILGSYATFYLWNSLKFNPYTAIPLSMLIVGIVGLGIERITFRPIKGTSKLNEIFLSLALILIIQNLLAQLVVEVQRDLKPVIVQSPYNLLYFELGLVRLPYDFAVMLLVTAAFLSLFFVIIGRTRFGRRLRAVSQNRTAASLMGVDVEKVDMISFGIGAALAAMAGSFFGILNNFDVYSGTVPAIKAFAVIILGGLGSIPGAVLGGFILGLAENFAAFTLGGVWKDAAAFAFLTVVLILRPEGLFGEKT